jgi:hypothetical protein
MSSGYTVAFGLPLNEHGRNGEPILWAMPQVIDAMLSQREYEFGEVIDLLFG